MKHIGEGEHSTRIYLGSIEKDRKRIEYLRPLKEYVQEEAFAKEMLGNSREILRNSLTRDLISKVAPMGVTLAQYDPDLCRETMEVCFRYGEYSFAIEIAGALNDDAALLRAETLLRTDLDFRYEKQPFIKLVGAFGERIDQHPATARRLYHESLVRQVPLLAIGIAKRLKDQDMQKQAITHMLTLADERILVKSQLKQYVESDPDFVRSIMLQAEEMKAWETVYEIAKLLGDEASAQMSLEKIKAKRDPNNWVSELFIALQAQDTELAEQIIEDMDPINHGIALDLLFHAKRRDLVDYLITKSLASKEPQFYGYGAKDAFEQLAESGEESPEDMVQRCEELGFKETAYSIAGKSGMIDKAREGIGYALEHKNYIFAESLAARFARLDPNLVLKVFDKCLEADEPIAAQQLAEGVEKRNKSLAWDMIEKFLQRGYISSAVASASSFPVNVDQDKHFNWLFSWCRKNGYHNILRTLAVELAKRGSQNLESLHAKRTLLAKDKEALFADVLKFTNHHVMRTLAAVLTLEELDSFTIKYAVPASVRAQFDRGRAKHLSKADRPDHEAMLQRYRECFFTVQEADTRSLGEVAPQDIADILFHLSPNEIIAELKGRIDRAMLKSPQMERMITVIAEYDVIAGRDIMLHFLGNRDLPAHLFEKFINRLVDVAYITEAVNQYLGTPREISVLRKIIASHKNQFNTTIETLSQIPEYSIIEHEKEIFAALADLGCLTPLIFIEWRKAGHARTRVLNSIESAKPLIFRNKPIEQCISLDPALIRVSKPYRHHTAPTHTERVAQKKRTDFIEERTKHLHAEIIYLIYRPVEMSFSKALGILAELPDLTKQLRKYRFAQDGYVCHILQRGYELKKGAEINTHSIDRLQKFITPLGLTDVSADPEVQKSLRGIARVDTSYTDEDIQNLFSLIHGASEVQYLREAFDSSIRHQRGFFTSYLRMMRHMIEGGVYAAVLSKLLTGDPRLKDQLLLILKKPSRRAQLEKQLGGFQDWSEIEKSNTALAGLLTKIFQEKIVKKVKELATTEIGKFAPLDTEGTDEVPDVRAYISKNNGSFLAKGSVGLCSAEDVELYERADHFHINIIQDGDRVVGNVQAFIGPEGPQDDSQFLILRGFNQEENFFGQSSNKSFCEEILRIAKEFARANGLGGVYITEQRSLFLSLSNRKENATYLLAKYGGHDNEREYRFLGASGDNYIDYIYRVSDDALPSVKAERP